MKVKVELNIQNHGETTLQEEIEKEAKNELRHHILRG